MQFSDNSRPVGRLGLGLELGSGLHVMGRLGSGPRVMGQCLFSNLRFNSRGNVLGGEGNCSAGEMSVGNLSGRKCPTIAAREYRRIRLKKCEPVKNSLQIEPSCLIAVTKLPARSVAVGFTCQVL